MLSFFSVETPSEEVQRAKALGMAVINYSKPARPPKIAPRYPYLTNEVKQVSSDIPSSPHEVIPVSYDVVTVPNRASSSPNKAIPLPYDVQIRNKMTSSPKKVKRNEFKQAFFNRVRSPSDEVKEFANKVTSSSNEVKSFSKQVKSSSNEVKSSSNQVKEFSKQVKSSSNEAKSFSNQVKLSTNEVKLLSNQVKSSANDVESFSNQVKSSSYEDKPKEVRRLSTQLQPLPDNLQVSDEMQHLRLLLEPHNESESRTLGKRSVLPPIHVEPVQVEHEAGVTRARGMCLYQNTLFPHLI